MMDNDDVEEEEDGGKGIRLVMTDKELEYVVLTSIQMLLSLSLPVVEYTVRLKDMLEFAVN